MTDEFPRHGRLPSPTRTIADPFADLLQHLPPSKRQGVVSQLTVGYYDGWRPQRSEVADLVAVELGILRWDEAAHRQRIRKAGGDPGCIAPRILGTGHRP